MNELVLAADYPERVRSLVVVDGAARMLRVPDYQVGAQARRADPFLTVALEPDAAEQGFDVPGVRRAKRCPRRCVPCVVGSGRQPRGRTPLFEAVRVLGMEVRVGIHAGEVEVRGA